jgi:hypothetical protein
MRTCRKIVAGRGELDVHVELPPDADIGDLSASFKAVTAQLAADRTELAGQRPAPSSQRGPATGTRRPRSCTSTSPGVTSPPSSDKAWSTCTPGDVHGWPNSWEVRHERRRGTVGHA